MRRSWRLPPLRWVWHRAPLAVPTLGRAVSGSQPAPRPRGQRCATTPATLTGLCNAEGILPAAGTFITNPYPSSGAANRPPPGVAVASVTLQNPTAATAGSVTATLALRRGARYPAANHRLSLLPVDDTGTPLGVDYTQQTTTTDPRGNVASVKLTIPAGTVMPSHLKAYVISDVFRLAQRQLY